MLIFPPFPVLVYPRSSVSISDPCRANPCTTTDSGDVPNPDDPNCITYYWCANYQIFRKETCPVHSGEQNLFDPAKGYCDWPGSVTCNGGSGQSATDKFGQMLIKPRSVSSMPFSPSHCLQSLHGTPLHISAEQQKGIMNVRNRCSSSSFLPPSSTGHD